MYLQKQVTEVFSVRKHSKCLIKFIGNLLVTNVKTVFSHIKISGNKVLNIGVIPSKIIVFPVLPSKITFSSPVSYRWKFFQKSYKLLRGNYVIKPFSLPKRRVVAFLEKHPS